MSQLLMELGDKQLHLSSENFFQLAEQLSAGVVLTMPSLEKPNPKIVYVNKIVQAITGYSAEELIGQSPRIFQGEKTNRQMMDTLKQNLSEGRSFRGETINYRKNGSPYEVELNVSPIFDENGQISYFMGIQYDMSAKRDAERAFLATEQLQLALEAEKKLNTMKADFINHFTEHMRQPLTVIRVAAELLERHGGQITEARIHSRLRLIMNEVDYLAAALDDVRIAANGFDSRILLHPQNMEIAVLIKDVISHVEEVYPERHFSFESSSLVPQQLYLDGRLVRIILQHILSNAAKFSAPKSEIRVSLRPMNGKVEIRVVDKGIGIPQDSLPHLFEQYYRAPNALSYKGIGLGLVIVRKNLELLGGSIQIESQENLGTSVSIILPKELRS